MPLRVPAHGSSSLVEQLKALKAYLQSLKKSQNYATVLAEQASHCKSIIESCGKLDLLAAAPAVEVINSMPFSSDEKSSILAVLNNAFKDKPADSNRKSMQDFLNLPNFFLRSHWQRLSTMPYTERLSEIMKIAIAGGMLTPSEYSKAMILILVTGDELSKLNGQQKLALYETINKDIMASLRKAKASNKDIPFVETLPAAFEHLDEFWQKRMYPNLDDMQERPVWCPCIAQLKFMARTYPVRKTNSAAQSIDWMFGAVQQQGHMQLAHGRRTAQPLLMIGNGQPALQDEQLQTQDRNSEKSNLFRKLTESMQEMTEEQAGGHPATSAKTEVCVKQAEEQVGGRPATSAKTGVCVKQEAAEQQAAGSKQLRKTGEKLQPAAAMQRITAAVAARSEAAKKEKKNGKRSEAPVDEIKAEPKQESSKSKGQKTKGKKGKKGSKKVSKKVSKKGKKGSKKSQSAGDGQDVVPMAAPSAAPAAAIAPAVNGNAAGGQQRAPVRWEAFETGWRIKHVQRKTGDWYKEYLAPDSTKIIRTLHAAKALGFEEA